MQFRRTFPSRRFQHGGTRAVEATDAVHASAHTPRLREAGGFSPSGGRGVCWSQAERDVSPGPALPARHRRRLSLSGTLRSPGDAAFGSPRRNGSRWASRCAVVSASARAEADRLLARALSRGVAESRSQRGASGGAGVQHGAAVLVMGEFRRPRGGAPKAVVIAPARHDNHGAGFNHRPGPTPRPADPRFALV
jgi:hypothetical protein